MAFDSVFQGPPSGANAPGTAQSPSLGVDVVNKELYISSGNGWQEVQSGTVTSVALSVPVRQTVTGSPITGNGTLSITDNVEPVNTVFAGPSSGPSATPTFRALAAADLPLATSGAFGAVKPDGTTVTVSGGAIAVGSIPESSVTNLTTDLASKAPSASPTFSGLTTVNNQLTVSAVATPVNAAFSTTSTGGTLAAGTYFYRVAALTATGTTLASAETSQVVPAGTSTNTVVVNWGAVAGATGYKVYGRTTGAELLMATLGVVTTWIDTGAVTPSGALPAFGTTGSILITTPSSTVTAPYSIGIDPDIANGGRAAMYILPQQTGDRIYFGRATFQPTLNFAQCLSWESVPSFSTAGISASGANLPLSAPFSNGYITTSANPGQASGIGKILDVIGTIGESGTAGYTALRVSPFESTLGSGQNLLLDLGTDTNATGTGTHTSVFKVSNKGIVGESIGASIASAATIAPIAGITHITGTVTITTITVPTGFTTTGIGVVIKLIPDGLWSTATGGNIALGTTAVVGKVLTMTYDPATTLWYPSY